MTKIEQPHPTYTAGGEADWSLIPDHMIGGLRRYLEHGIPPGSFLRAVLTNDLRGAVECADQMNIHRLPDYIRFLHNFAPKGSWGSLEAYEAWISHKGLRSVGWTSEVCRD